MYRRAFTIIEILIVIAILLILAAIAFIALKPSRVSAKRVACGYRLQQIYQAATLYTIDWDDSDRYDEIQGLTYLPHSFSNLDPYLKEKEIWYCPACPPHIKSVLGNSYGLMLAGDGSSESKKVGQFTMPARRKRMIEIHRRHGSATPVAWCGIHDEFEVAPSDPLEGREKMQPWIKWVGIDGSIRQGRVDWTNGRPSFAKLLKVIAR